MRDHLFISYAWEDSALAEWLTLKLTSLGYKVWCDRFQLLGGESYPRDIDLAIKDRSFRVIALLSRSSIGKQNPVKERTLALNIGRARSIDFLIPVNVDGLRPTELDWMDSDLTFIAFDQSWNEGIVRLIKKLEAIAAPRDGSGSAAVSEWFESASTLASRTETLKSNLFEFNALPSEIYWMRRTATSADLPDEWPAYADGEGVWMLEVPDGLAAGDGWVIPMDLEGPGQDDQVRRVFVNLLRQYLRRRCKELGLAETPTGEMYFPPGLLDGDRLPFAHYSGRMTSLQAVGFKTFRSGARTSRNKHHLVVGWMPRLDRFGSPAAELDLRVYLTDETGAPLPARLVNRRRKKVARSWFNHQWWSRTNAVARWFSGAQSEVNLALGPAQIVMSATPIALSVDVGIDESAMRADQEEPDVLDDESPDDLEDLT
jgi:hypothetical protein